MQQHLGVAPYETKILDVKVNFGFNLRDAVDYVDKTFLSEAFNGVCHYICTTNPEFVLAAQKDPEFMALINRSDLSLPDGAGLVLANYYLEKVKKLNSKGILKVGQSLIFGIETAFAGITGSSVLEKKIPGRKLMHSLLELASQKNYTVFLLGGKQRDKKGKLLEDSCDLATLATENIRKIIPNITIIGASSEFSADEKDDALTLAYIKNCMKNHNVTNLDLLFVAYGQVRQEKWIKRNSEKIPVKLSVGVGGTLDYFSGYSKVPADIITENNIEWLDRLVREPWRYKRVLNAFPVFPLKIFFKSLFK